MSLRDYSPDGLARKWAGQPADLISPMVRLWEQGRPRKRLFSFAAHSEPDSNQDQMIPAEARRILLYKGNVVMGHFARAFFPAYIPGKITHYGSVVYASDPVPVDSLFELAWRVNELRKDNSPPPKS